MGTEYNPDNPFCNLTQLVVIFSNCTGVVGRMIVSGFSPLGVDPQTLPQSRQNQTFQVADTVLWARGNHHVSTGFEARRVALKSAVERLFRPHVLFSNAFDLSSNQISSSGAMPGIFLANDMLSLGRPASFVQTLALQPDPTIDLRSTEYAGFFADQWRLRRNLSISIGVRYQLSTVPTDAERRIESSFGSREVQDFIAYETELSGTSGLATYLAGRKNIYRQDNNNLAPYLAAAWDIRGDGHTVIRGGYGIYYDQIPGSVVGLSRAVYPNFLRINAAGTMFNALPGFVMGFSASPYSAQPSWFATPGTLNVFDRGLYGSYISILDLAYHGGLIGVEQNVSPTPFGPEFELPNIDLRTPYGQHWGLTLEHAVGSHLTVSAAYAGTRGVALLRQSTPNGGQNGIPIIGTDNDRTISPPKVYPFLGSVVLINSDANSRYDSLQLEARQRLSGGIQFTAAYTWSHAIDDVSDIFDVAGAPALPQDSHNLRAERGDSNFDARQRLTGSFVWELPLWRQRAWLGGWTFSAMGVAATGQPYTLLSGMDTNLDGNLTDRLNSTAGITIVNRGPARLAVPVNYFPLLAAPGQDGALGRNTFRGQGTAAIDAAIEKTFTLSEHHRIAVRVEAFNLTNHPNFALPINQVNIPSAGNSVATSLPARTIQLSARWRW